jgi:DDE family transposase
LRDDTRSTPRQNPRVPVVDLLGEDMGHSGNQRGTCKQWIEEGKNAAKWTRLSCCSFAANAVRLQLHALAYNLANFLRTLALSDDIEKWSLSSLREKLVKIGAKLVAHGRYMTFHIAEVAVPSQLFGEILRMIDGLRSRPAPA